MNIDKKSSEKRGTVSIFARMASLLINSSARFSKVTLLLKQTGELLFFEKKKKIFY